MCNFKTLIFAKRLYTFLSRDSKVYLHFVCDHFQWANSSRYIEEKYDIFVLKNSSWQFEMTNLPNSLKFQMVIPASI